MKTKKAKLTIEEEKAWVHAFDFYVDEGKTPIQADELAWKDIQKQFPRLLKFEGCI